MTPTMKPVERPVSLGEQVYRTLRTHLCGGVIVAGQPLQEMQLADQLGVSRTPVREALRRLSNEGLLVSDGRSFVVPELSLGDVDDIYEVRFLVEPAAIRRVAGITRDRERRRSIEDALAAAADAHRADDAEAFREANIRFRAAWLSLVPNPRLVRIVEQYSDHMQRIRMLTLDDREIRSIVLRGLTRISLALAAGDADAAAAAMREHLSEAKHAFTVAIGLAGGDTDRPGHAQGSNRQDPSTDLTLHADEM